MNVFLGQKQIRKSSAYKLIQDCASMSLFDVPQKYAVLNRKIVNCLTDNCVIPPTFTIVEEAGDCKRIQEYLVTNI